LEVITSRWGSYLSCDNVEFSFIFCQAQIGFHEVVAPGTVNRAGAEDQVIRNALFNDLVTLEFAPLWQGSWPRPFRSSNPAFPCQGH
jgi:hypothetical protein